MIQLLGKFLRKFGAVLSSVEVTFLFCFLFSSLVRSCMCFAFATVLFRLFCSAATLFMQGLLEMAVNSRSSQRFRFESGDTRYLTSLRSVKGLYISLGGCTLQRFQWT